MALSQEKVVESIHTMHVLIEKFLEQNMLRRPSLTNRLF